MRRNLEASSGRLVELGPKESALEPTQIVGRGVYSFARAAEIAGVSPRSLRRWTSDRQGQPGSLPAHPLVRLDIPEIGDEHVLSFLNLVEVKLVGEFRRLGLSLQYIRRVVDVLAQSFDVAHPLAYRRLQTDGRSVFAEIDESGEFACVEIAGSRPNHVVFEDVIRPLFREIDFLGTPTFARRWFPLGRQGGVVVDPELAFGEPVLTSSGIPTRTLARQVMVAGDSVDEVARWFEVSAEAVVTALDYESGLRTKAA